MKSIKSAGDRFFAVMAYIIVILSIMSTTVMWNYLKGAFIPIGTYRYLLLAISILLVLVTNSYNFKDLSFITLIICYLLVFIFFSQINPFKYFSNLCMPLTASLLIVFVYYQHGKGNLLLASYANIVLIVAGVSLFFYFFGSILGLRIGAIDTNYYWADTPHFTTSYCYLYFHQPLQDQIYLGHHVIRNTGIFTEAPGYTLFLLDGLIIELFVKKSKTFWRIGLILVTLLTTLSATAILLGALAVLLSFLQYLQAQGKLNLKIVIPVFLLLLVLGVIVIRIRKSGGSSYSVRVDDLRIGLTLWSQNPVFGVGFGNEGALIKMFAFHRANNGLSMGLTTLMATGGLYLALYFLVPFFTTLFAPSRRYLLPISILLLLEIIISNISTNPVYLMAMALLWYAVLNDIREQGAFAGTNYYTSLYF
ncbi:beta-carotene 15,15'-monooxygenase [Lactobacillus delbrueckii subsp. bulgaricus]|uniref:beta-carotene 15,15'-monooxygenase n=1 Tax=Lactobacillus delbrueckii TaxID=1584 RepID=UPI001C1E04D5|nr:beta-carotene 15,15'-monooxygenase [Lactobacillus delbrueckii]MBU6049964.1 beta-carotene 15,15'-monooxygenase [Lactobacillus delbrueckii]MCD5462700.1 beta-carotene 15,15'-monooxygenase [Lactobacillus delbrueckii subsp. bulgaricus]MCD5478285.1 beta-carotene 15,15'-monooxygenase [Lactobacillus delbrueckii subsp. bulgaricus]MCT3478408.1 beta-carotene 15,15'-monooxygenase [Lactobacillus delbrueckii subsp. bulgaricus]MCT3480338.1 beta-carotene 15,15'-monooxygenase [Lactobacillus delbrueckii subs